MSARHRQHHVGSVPRRDDGHALAQPLENVLGRHPRDEDAQHLAVEQAVVATAHGAADRIPQFGDRRGDEQRFLRQHVALGGHALQRLGHRRQLRGIAPVGDHGGRMGVLPGDLGEAQFDDVRDVLGCPIGGAHGEHDRGAKVDRDARVHAQLAGRGDVGVIAADDQHGVAAFGDGVIARDDVGQRRVGIVVQLLVTDTDAVLVGQPGGRVRQQEIEDVVLSPPAESPGSLRSGPRPWGRLVIGRNTPTFATVDASRCRMPSAIVDLPVSPSGDAT